MNQVIDICNPFGALPQVPLLGVNLGYEASRAKQSSGSGYQIFVKRSDGMGCGTFKADIHGS